MKFRNILLLVIGCIATFVAGLFVGSHHADKPPGQEVVSEETTVDTILYRAPMPQSELALGTHFYTLPLYRFHGGGSGGEPRCKTDSAMTLTARDTSVTASALVYGTGAGGEPRCSKDSAIVELPIIQRHYADSTYEAWVSGPVDPRLDSLRVFAPTTIITKREWKPPKRWHIGVTAGYGYGAKGFQPYIGVGITYSIFSF